MKSALLIAAVAAITPLVKATELTIARYGSQVVVYWPRGGTNDFYLQFTTNLLAPVDWRLAADPAAVGSVWVVTNEIAGTSRFYRLQTWETLFDGTTTAAFRGYLQSEFPGTDIWRVTANGELEAVPDGTSIDLITTNQYADFELRWEWKTSLYGNSGVNYRATELYSRAEWSGPEYQLLDDPSHSTIPQNTMGAVWNLIAPTNKTLVPRGDWNRCRLMVQRNHVEHWLNGNRVVSYELDSPAFRAAVDASPTFNTYPEFARAGVGHIALRHEDTLIWYRNIKIRRLPPE